VPRVALFVTCVVDQVFPEVGRAAVALLEAAGCAVDFPAAQTCCGQPALSAGEPAAAARLARHFLDTFEPYDAIVAPSGSCVAMLRHWYTRLPDVDGTRAERVAGRAFELSQYLVDVLGRPDLGARLDGTVTVHDSCHGLRTLGVRDSTRVLLEAAGARVVEMREPETCCGFGGVFAMTHGEISTPLADRKLLDAAATRAQHVVAGDIACLAHLAGRRRRTHVGPEPVHFAVLLAGGLS
jgi:L-lactate dehydrogenase complex protein LldE